MAEFFAKNGSRSYSHTVPIARDPPRGTLANLGIHFEANFIFMTRTTLCAPYLPAAVIKSVARNKAPPSLSSGPPTRDRPVRLGGIAIDK